MGEPASVCAQPSGPGRAVKAVRQAAPPGQPQAQKKGAPKGAPKWLLTAALALAGLEARIGLVDHINPALAADDAARLVAGFCRLQRIDDFHGVTENMGGQGSGGPYGAAPGLSTAAGLVCRVLRIPGERPGAGSRSGPCGIGPVDPYPTPIEQAETGFPTGYLTIDCGHNDR